MEAVVYNQDGKKAGSVSIPSEVFGAKWNPDLVHQVALAQRENERDAIAHTKGRDEVRGGGKKPWRQKGTGRARHGSSRSPIWVGGGVAHGPRNEKNFTQQIPRRMKSAALAAVLSKKFAEGEVIFVKEISVEAKTKEAKAIVMSLATIDGLSTLAGKRANALALIVPEASTNTTRAFQNMGNVLLVTAGNINLLSLLQYRFVAIVSPDVSNAALAKRVSFGAARKAKKNAKTA